MAKKATKKAAPKKAAKATKKAAPKKAVKATKKAAPKKVAKPAAKPAKKAKSARKPNAAFMKPLTPSKELAAIVGNQAQPRTEVVKKMWAYIKKNGLQDSKNKRQINSDEKLKPIFGGKNSVSMFEMTALVSKHLS